MEKRDYAGARKNFLRPVGNQTVCSDNRSYDQMHKQIQEAMERTQSVLADITQESGNEKPGCGCGRRAESRPCGCGQRHDSQIAACEACIQKSEGGCQTMNCDSIAEKGDCTPTNLCQDVPLVTAYIPPQPYTGLVAPETALARGSSFTNLYWPWGPGQKYNAR